MHGGMPAAGKQPVVGCVWGGGAVKSGRWCCTSNPSNIQRHARSTLARMSVFAAGYARACPGSEGGGAEACSHAHAICGRLASGHRNRDGHRRRRDGHALPGAVGSGKRAFGFGAATKRSSASQALVHGGILRDKIKRRKSVNLRAASPPCPRASRLAAGLPLTSQCQVKSTSAGPQDGYGGVWVGTAESERDMDVPGRADAWAASATRHRSCAAIVVVIICEAREEGAGGGRMKKKKICRSINSINTILPRPTTWCPCHWCARSWTGAVRGRRTRARGARWLFRKVLRW
jgi:hypothetical protein